VNPKLKTLNFKKLHSDYMTLAKHPDGDYFSCAIRLSIDLERSGAYNKQAYKKAGNKVSPNGWAMVAEQLYQWLRKHSLGEARRIEVDSSNSPNIPKQNGIIYLRNCFTRTTDSSDDTRTGDHFDLFLKGQGILSAIRWPEEFPGGPYGLIGTCRDKKIRFWPVA